MPCTVYHTNKWIKESRIISQVAKHQQTLRTDRCNRESVRFLSHFTCYWKDIIKLYWRGGFVHLSILSVSGLVCGSKTKGAFWLMAALYLQPALKCFWAQSVCLFVCGQKQMVSKTLINWFSIFTSLKTSPSHFQTERVSEDVFNSMMLNIRNP